MFNLETYKISQRRPMS